MKMNFNFLSKIAATCKIFFVVFFVLFVCFLVKLWILLLLSKNAEVLMFFFYKSVGEPIMAH